MNLVSILIPFLLLAAQFVTLAVIDSTLPAITQEVSKPPEEKREATPHTHHRHHEQGSDDPNNGIVTGGDGEEEEAAEEGRKKSLQFPAQPTPRTARALRTTTTRRSPSS